MKRIISILILLAVMTSAWAQPQRGDKKHGDWREKVRAEQVAFITNELNLTEAEAQAFWPVYNDVQNTRREAFKALQDGLEGNDVENLLNNYISTKQACDANENEAIKKYKAVLPAEKVAKLLLDKEVIMQDDLEAILGPKVTDKEPEAEVEAEPKPTETENE